MSEKKSWDVVPKRNATPVPAPATPVRVQKTQTPQRARAAVQSKPQSASRPQSPAQPRPQPHSKQRLQRVQQSPARPRIQPLGSLGERRRKRVKTMRIVSGATLVLSIAALIYVLWLPALRITTVEANGPGADVAQQTALATMSGTYFHIFPRNSVFLYPNEEVRANVLAAVPEAAALSPKRTSFSSLALTTEPRAEAFIWCGTSMNDPLPNGTCYSADVNGFIFRAVGNTQGESTQQSPQPDPAEGTSTPSTPSRSPASSGSQVLAITSLAKRATFARQAPTGSATSSLPTKQVPTSPTSATLGQVRVYGALSGTYSVSSTPVGAYVANASHMPDAFTFVNAVRELGAPVSSLSLRDDEADLWVGSSTRITYVLGHEKAAAELAASTIPNLALANSNVQYVDLRFPGKVYIKRYGE